jgi:hypothetical protein
VSRILLPTLLALASACGAGRGGGTASGIGTAATIATAGTAGADAAGDADEADLSDAGAPDESPPPVDPAACDCSTSSDEPIELHVLARDLTRERMDALAALLAKDGFEVSFVEYADESSAPKVAIQASPSRFVAVFGGRIEAHVEAMSSRDGFSCRLEVEGSVVPKRYRKLVVAVRTPDPQLY